MRKQFGAVVRREDDCFVAQRLEVDAASQGETEEAASANLNSAF